MSVINSVELTKDGITYILTKEYIDFDASGNSSNRAVYGLTRTTSNRGHSRKDIIFELQRKFGLNAAQATRIVDHLDHSKEQEPVVRKTTDAPRVIGGGIPTRPLAAIN